MILEQAQIPTIDPHRILHTTSVLSIEGNVKEPVVVKAIDLFNSSNVEARVLIYRVMAILTTVSGEDSPQLQVGIPTQSNLFNVITLQPNESHSIVFSEGESLKYNDAYFLEVSVAHAVNYVIKG